jgi:hypothetical protein
VNRGVEIVERRNKSSDVFKYSWVAPNIYKAWAVLKEEEKRTHSWSEWLFWRHRSLVATWYIALMILENDDGGDREEMKRSESVVLYTVSNLARVLM